MARAKKKKAAAKKPAKKATPKKGKAKAKAKAKAKPQPKSKAKPKPNAKTKTSAKAKPKAKAKKLATLVDGLRAWIDAGGEIDEFLPNRHDAVIQTADEVATICDALDTLHAKPDHGGDSFTSALHTLTAFFQSAETREAYDAFARDGLPRLRRYVREAIDGGEAKHDDVLFILKILCMYREDDVDLIAEVLRKPIAPDDFMWSIVFRFDANHPHSKKMMDMLRDPLPPEFAGVALLDNANQLALAGAIDSHPFDSPAGRERLEGFLRDPKPENFSYAHSATAALPFLSAEHRADLLDVAVRHPETNVQIEAAWAAAKCGDAAGIDRLAQFALAPQHAAVAQRYLEELGCSDRIPQEALEPGFRAVAAMAEWLAHPNELGHAPESIELVDQRELNWPPTGDRRQVALVRYDDADSEGVGMVGSITFCLFGETTTDLSPEDLYGIHCCWELEMNGDKRAPKKRSAKAGRALLAAVNPGF